MRKFSEMDFGKIGTGATYQTFVPQISETDPVVRTYNNCYGLFTDTHMGKISEDEYVITGSLCSIPEKFDQFLYSFNYGLGTTFKVDGRAKTLSCFLSENGLCGQYACLNGDKVYKISRKPFDLSNGPSCEICAQSCDYVGIPVPRQLGEKAIETLGQLIENSKTSEELQNAANECSEINGNDWTVFGTSSGFGMVSESAGTAILFSVTEAKVGKRYRI